jgi:hypothetical protein
LLTPERVRKVFAQMRGELYEMAARHRAEVMSLRAELDGLHAQFDALRAVSLARSKAELEVAELHRLREIGRAQAVERDWNQPLQ